MEAQGVGRSSSSGAAMVMEPVRIRVAFEDRHVLSKPLRREGLKQSWVLLRPELDTVAALASHIVHSFGLQDSCPSGLILSMDRFVLPPFESTDIFRDKDILRARKRGGALMEAIKFCHDANRIGDSEIVDKQPLRLCDSTIVAEEFERESGGYQSEDEEDSGDQPIKAVCPETPLGGKACSKRKRDSDRLMGSKRKKTKLTGADAYPLVLPEAAGNIHLEHKENHSQEDVHKETHSQEDGIKPGNPSRRQRSTGKSQMSKPNASTGKSLDHTTEDRHVEAHERCQRNATEPDVNGSNNKIPSRTARRKKAKRLWLRELKNSGKKELIQSDIIENGPRKKSEVHHTLDHGNDFEEEVVPVVVKPGHIRFEPLGQSEQLLDKPAETLKWNGTVSKKKGQKWGREKNFDCLMSEENALPVRLNAESVVEQVDKGDQLIEFEKLFPLTRLPKEDDVLAYRVVELSSSWCPELSSFRVGKVTSYDPTSKKIILVQVRDYPISFRETDEEGSGAQPNNSLYKEDGSLEIDFPSLHDVRLFNEDSGTLNASISERKSMGTVSSIRIPRSGSASRSNHKANGAIAQPTENEHSGGWEEICRALDAKKTELSQKKGWGSWDKKETTTSPSWSYRALRWGAVGPTVSLLRSKNDI